MSFKEEPVTAASERHTAGKGVHLLNLLTDVENIRRTREELLRFALRAVFLWLDFNKRLT